ncbi:S8 family serine peptidase [Calothrix sp. FACHB-1219]|uniref:S8 family peptidase n=1 Tax=unclassified Calothrix TaxID=2619626 RepID=UPI0016892F33|nr:MULTISPECIES: S8 family peptidase [unclassified Calothrix]MBD2205318.1 S8 family serine peptidase [Calothrix sp. FACHB-168]MBD2220090.1 S8 family serine peptidase [Calothrix sp. FACHB-1219]
MPNASSNNSTLTNNGLNINTVSFADTFTSQDDYNFNLSGRSSFDNNINAVNANSTQAQSLNSEDTMSTMSYDSTTGYGLVNAAAGVARGIGQNTFTDVPDLGGNSWNVDMVKAPEVWARGYTGQDIVVAVIDTGVDYNHIDLQNNIWTNTGEVANNGIDDDGNGYIDDIHGWNFVENSNDPIDRNGHGTHVSGTIAGENNGTGVTGIAYNSRIMPVKVLNDSGSGSISSITQGIYYAVNQGARVINLSLGSDFPNNSLASAIEYASSKGVVVVMAAGNNGLPILSYPASYANRWGLAVGAVDRNNQIAEFSNTPGISQLAYVTAPGVDIYSSLPGNQYGSYNGTSMAAPHVAGVVALMLSANPSLTDAQVRQFMTQTAGNGGQNPDVGLSAGWLADEFIAEIARNPAKFSTVNFDDNAIAENQTIDLSANSSTPAPSVDIFSNANINSQYRYYDSSLQTDNNNSPENDQTQDIQSILERFQQQMDELRQWFANP